MDIQRTQVWKIKRPMASMQTKGIETAIVENESTKVEASVLDESSLREAAEVIRSGGVVAFPTETVYGLGADARSDQAVQHIFEAKGRPPDNPLIVHIADRDQLNAFVAQPDRLTEKLMQQFWPGPLTLIIPVRPGGLSTHVTAGLDTVAVRMPDHEVALAFLRAAGCPIAAPSANRSGTPSPTRADHVLNDLRGRIDGVVDGGVTGIGLESTVVQVRNDVVHVLRPGGITLEQLREVHADVRVDQNERFSLTDEAKNVNTSQAPRSPGMKYAHYAPKGTLTLVVGEHEEVTSRIIAELEWARVQEQKTGVLVFEEHAHAYVHAADEIITCGRFDQLEEGARKLYDALREFDEREVTVIFAEGWPEVGIGFAVMNRLYKAAAGHVIHVGTKDIGILE